MDQEEKTRRVRNLDLEHLAKLEYLDPVQAAEYANSTASTLAKKRVYGGGPPFIRVSPRKILYRRADVDAWLAERRVAA